MITVDLIVKKEQSDSDDNSGSDCNSGSDGKNTNQCFL